MPSVKAYRARKRDIEILKTELFRAESDKQSSALVIDNAKRAIDVLLVELKKYKIRCSILESYIRHAYWDDLENPVTTPSEIPKCLNPFDAIKFAGGPEPMAFPTQIEE